MSTAEAAVMTKKTKLSILKQPRTPGTERWPKPCVTKGNFFLVPRVLYRDLKSFGTKHRHFRPHHLWLLLALQTDRFRDNPPRYYWETIAQWCGRDRNTVRRWGYQLKGMGLLAIEECRKLDPDQTRGPGRRNERNKFFLEPFEDKVLEVHRRWEKKRRRTAPSGTGSGEDEAPAAAEAP
jgi:hypothetical protein